MWRKLLGVVLGVLLLSVGVGVVVANAATPQNAVPMTGRALMDSSQQQSRLLFSADATDGSGWHLEIALRLAVASSRSRSSQYSLAGTYSLSRSGSSTIAGTATGQLSQRGDGSLHLAGEAGTPGLDASFSVGNTGQLQLDLSGQLPSITTPGTVETGQTQTVNHLFWYLSRALGFSAYAALFLNVCLGLLISARWSGAFLARWQTLDLHQFTGLLSLALTAGHVFVLLGDRYVGLTLDQLLVPFASAYRPFWTAVGLAGCYGLAVVVVSHYVRQWIGHTIWRTLHYTTFGLLVLVMAHSVMSGSDTGEPWAAFLYGVSGAIVAILTLWRFTGPESKRPVTAGSGGSSQPQAARP